MLGDALLYAALAGAVAAPVAFLASLLDESYARHGRLLSGATAGLLLAALGYLAVQFLVTDYTNGYVWNHTADFHSPFYRLTGVYAGIEGSMLLWATFVSLAAFWVVRDGLDDQNRRLVAVLLALVVAYLAGLVVLRSPFDPLTLSSRGVTFGPRGLNPLLVNPYMGIHPPVTFLGYALTTVPFAVGVVHFVRTLRGEDGLFPAWWPLVTWWLRGSWVTLTAAVGLGAFWSYNTLGWGGLWAWDQVETAVLVAWLFVTATLHAVANARRRERNPLLAAALATLAFPAVVFSRYITVGGFSTLHSFGFASSTPTLVLLGLTTAAGVGLPLAAWLSEPAPDDDGTLVLSVDRLLYLSVLVLLVLTFVYAWGIVFPVLFRAVTGDDVSVTVDFFNLWSYPFAVLSLLLVGTVNEFELRGRRAWVTALAVVVVTVLVAWLPMPDWRFAASASTGYYGFLGSLNSLSLLPPAVYAVALSGARFLQRGRLSTARRDRLAALGRCLIHVGLAIVIVATPFTYLFATTGSWVVPTEADQDLVLGETGATVHVHETATSRQGAAVSFTRAERERLTAEIDARGYRADRLPASASGPVIVWGRPTAVAGNASRTLIQLQGSDVWIETSPDALGDRSRSSLTDGETRLYTQGTLRDGSADRRLVVTDGRFLGTDPVDAVVPAFRVTTSRVHLTYAETGGAVVSGRAELHSQYPYGVVTNVLIGRGALEDTYVIPLQVTSMEDVPVVVLEVKHIPLMNVVRLGVLLLVLGGVLRLGSGSRTPESEDE